MNDDPHSLIPVPDDSITNTTAGKQRILATMVEETLALARKEQQVQTPVQASKRNIGDYEFCEPDYQQVLIWAQALAMKPEEVVRNLVQCGKKRPWEPRVLFPITNPTYEVKKEEAMAFTSSLFQAGQKSEEEVVDHFKAQFGDDAEDRLRKVANQLDSVEAHLRYGIDWHALESQLYFERWEERLGVAAAVLSGDVIQNGRIIKLHWDIDQLPLKTFEWVEGLEITCLAFFESHHSPFATTAISPISLQKISLPKLRYLLCEGFELAQLDLSNVNELRCLECGVNRLTSLDLSHVPQLVTLDCHGNRLTELNLGNVPLLRHLNCEENQLTRLELFPVPHLISLYCATNQLSKLNVGGAKELDCLVCSENSLAEFDITPLKSGARVSYDCDTTRLIYRPDQEELKR